MFTSLTHQRDQILFQASVILIKQAVRTHVNLTILTRCPTENESKKQNILITALVVIFIHRDITAFLSHDLILLTDACK